MIINKQIQTYPAIKKKISDTVYEIYPGSPPPTVTAPVYRNDFFSFTLIGFNRDDTPFDFSVFDKFRAQVRMGSGWNCKAIATINGGNGFGLNDLAVLGKSEPDGRLEWDELHMYFPNGIDFPENYPYAWMDIESVIKFDPVDEIEKRSFIKIKIPIEGDVTRIKNG